jgi:AraC-like DNA-binding protein
VRGQSATSIAPSLSDVLLNDLRVNTAFSVLLDIAMDGAVDIGDKRSPVVHAVLEGSIALSRPGANATLQLGAGDSVLAFYGDAHRLGTTNGAAAADVLAQPPDTWSEAPALIHLGQGSRAALLFSSAIRLDYVSPTAFAYRAAPDFWTLRKAGAADDSEERSLLFDAEQVTIACGGRGGTAFATAFASLQYMHMMRLMSLRLLRDRPLDVRAPNTRRMAQVVREIRAHPDQKWTVARLASRVGLSRSTFAEAFVAYEHVAPLTFVTRVRMERAAQLLRTEALSLQEVARRVGYENEASFARAFKRYKGVPPGKFARAMAKP